MRLNSKDRAALGWVACVVAAAAAAIAWPFIKALELGASEWGAVSSWAQAIGSFIALYVALRIAWDGEHRTQRRAEESASAFIGAFRMGLAQMQKAGEREDVAAFYRSVATMEEVVAIGQSLAVSSMRLHYVVAVVRIRAVAREVQHYLEKTKAPDLEALRQEAVEWDARVQDEVDELIRRIDD